MALTQQSMVFNSKENLKRLAYASLNIRKRFQATKNKLTYVDGR